MSALVYERFEDEVADVRREMSAQKVVAKINSYSRHTQAVARTKAKNQKRHAKRRAFERYALDLHQDAQASIVRAIQGGEARFLRRQSWRVTLWEVEHDGQRLPVVYDRKRKTIVTVLPEEALTQERNMTYDASQ
jgi:hypothetical protein